MGFRFPASWWRVPSWAFVWVSQSALCFLAGRLLKFSQLFAVINHVKVNILIICKCLVHSFHLVPKVSGFLLVFLTWIFLFKRWKFSFFSCSLLYCKRYVYISMYLSFLNWVCWVRGNFSGEPGPVYILCVCLCCVECRAGTSIFGHFGGVYGGTVRIFLFLWLCSGGYGTI